MWSTRSPASVVRCISEKHRGAWRHELKNTGMHATRGTQGNLPLQSISGISNIKRIGKALGCWTEPVEKKPVQLRVKEALYIQKTPTNNRLNCDKGYELPGCWITTVKKLGDGVSSSCTSANCVSAWTSTPDCTHAQAQEPRL